ncbi:hypothetical protein D9M72_432680 [compost metagenome]
MFVAMVDEVAFQIDRIGQPERQRRPSDRIVDTLIARRVPVNDLMLQRAVPGNQPAAKTDHEDNRKRLPEPGQSEKATINSHDQRYGLPFDAGDGS